MCGDLQVSTTLARALAFSALQSFLRQLDTTYQAPNPGRFLVLTGSKPDKGSIWCVSDQTSICSKCWFLAKSDLADPHWTHVKATGRDPPPVEA